MSQLLNRKPLTPCNGGPKLAVSVNLKAPQPQVARGFGGARDSRTSKDLPQLRASLHQGQNSDFDCSLGLLQPCDVPPRRPGLGSKSHAPDVKLEMQQRPA